jgi:superfamily II DNA helicase RecQ
VHLLTYHRAKGLEFDAVFLPRLEDKELPSRLARTAGDQAEERRLLYVGITRARRWLAITWSRRASPFLAELGVEAVRTTAVPRAPGASRAPAGTRAERPPRDTSPAAEALRRWRLERARAESVPPYVIFPDRTIDELLARRPGSPAELAAIHGLGPSRLGRFGGELFAVLGGLADAGPAPDSVEPLRTAAPVPPPKPAPPPAADANPAVYQALAAWRRRRAENEEVPPFYVFGNRVLAAIAEIRPRSHDELLAVPGVGPAKLERYGNDVLEVVAAAV